MGPAISADESFISWWTTPWKCVPREKESLLRSGVETVRRVVEGLLFGPVPIVSAVVVRVLPTRVSTKIVKYFSAPHELFQEEQSLPQQAALHLSTLGSAILIASLSNLWFMPFVSRPFSFFARHVNIVRWIEYKTPLSFPCAISTAAVYYSAASMHRRGPLIRLPGRVGSFSDFYSSVMHSHSSSLCIGVYRDLITYYPALVFMRLAADYRRYIRDGRHVTSLGREVRTEVLFSGEPGEGEGVTRVFFTFLMKCLLEGDDGRSLPLLDLTKTHLKEKGCTTTINDFYESMGVVLGALSMINIYFGFGLLMDEKLILAIQQVTRKDIISWKGNLRESQGALKRIALVLNAENEYATRALEGDDFEEMEPLLEGAARVLYICSGIHTFYRDQSEGWSGLIPSGFLQAKLIGGCDRKTIAFTVVESNDINEVVRTKVEWLKGWIESTSDINIRTFLEFISGVAVVASEPFKVYAISNTDGAIKAMACGNALSLSTTYNVGVDHTKEAFWKHLEWVIGYKGFNIK